MWPEQDIFPADPGFRRGRRSRVSQFDQQPFWWTLTAILAVGVPLCYFPIERVLKNGLDGDFSGLIAEGTFAHETLVGLSVGLRIGPCLAVLAGLTLLSRSLLERMGIVATFCILHGSSLLLVGNGFNGGGPEYTFWFPPESYHFAFQGPAIAIPIVLMLSLLRSFLGWRIEESYDQRVLPPSMAMSLTAWFFILGLAVIYLFPWIRDSLSTGAGVWMDDLENTIIALLAPAITLPLIVTLILGHHSILWKLLISTLLLPAHFVAGLPTVFRDRETVGFDAYSFLTANLTSTAYIASISLVAMLFCISARGLDMRLVTNRSIARTRPLN